MRLARAAVPPEGCGGHARLTFERPGEVALVREARGEGDPGERLIGGDELTGGEVYPQFADVVTHSTAAVLSETPGQVDGVDAGRCRDRLVSEVLGEPLLEQLSDPLKPAWGPPLRIAHAAARTFGQNLQHQSFHHQRGDPVIPEVFLIEPRGEPNR